MHTRAMRDHPTDVDVAVVGLGAMGSAALYHLAQRGVHVAGFDRHTPPHALGSTHGRSRIIREAYYEHPLYVPLVRRAYELWDALARDAQQPLFRQTGGLMIGPATGTLVAGARRSAREHALPHEVLSRRDAMTRFPAFAIPPDFVALHEPRAGMLDPEACVRAHLAGAVARRDEPVIRWESAGDGVVLHTAHGRYRARQMVVTAGAWTPGLVPELAAILRVERQVMHWFAPRRPTALLAPVRCPIAMIEYAPDRFFYTLPDAGHGVKAAIHHEGEITDPDHVRRAVSDDDVDRVARLLREYLPAADGRRVESAVCLYTNTPDQHFLIDRLPAHPAVLVVSACSGHGFKFASAIGELVADLVTDATPRVDPAPFGLARFTTREVPPLAR